MMRFSTPFRYLLFICLLTFLLRGLYLYEVWNALLMNIPVIDAHEYFEAALRWSQGDLLLSKLGIWYHGLGYPVLLGLLFKLFPPSPVVVWIFQSIIAGSISVCIALIAYKIKGWNAALVTGVAAASHGTALFLQTQVVPHGIISLFDAAGLILVMHGITTNRIRFFLLAGICFGSSALLWSNTLVPVFFLGIGVLWLVRPFQKALKTLLSITIPFLLLLLAIMIRNNYVGGEWEFLQKRGGFNFYYYNGPPHFTLNQIDPGYSFQELVDEPSHIGIRSSRAQSLYFIEKTIAWIRQNPGLYAKLFLERLSWVISNDELAVATPFDEMKKQSLLLRITSFIFGFGIFIPFSIIGVIHSLKQSPNSRATTILLCFIFGYLLTNVFLATGDRYRLPFTMLILPLVGVGFLELTQRIRTQKISVPLVLPFLLWIPSFIFSPPHPFQTAFYEGIALEQLGKFSEAERILEYATTERPTSTAAWKALGNVLQKQGKPEQARSAFEQAQALNPRDPSIYNSLGLVQKQLRNEDQALKLFEQALQLDPEHASALINLGNLYRDKANPDYETALALYRRVPDTESAYLQSRLEIANTLNLKGETDASELLYAELIRQKPDNALIAYNYGLLKLKAQEWSEAVLLLESAIHSDPDFQLAWFNLGVAQYNLGEYQKASEAFESCLVIRDGFLPAVSQLMMTYYKLGNKTKMNDLKQKYGKSIEKLMNSP